VGGSVLEQLKLSQAALKSSGPRLWSKTQPQRVGGVLRLVLCTQPRSVLIAGVSRCVFALIDEN